jgi:GNAT superfamily N-acetyltransferase
MNNVKIEVRCNPSTEESDFIFNRLVQFNESKVGDARFKEFGIFASSESEAIIAGLLGHRLWNGFFISALWVAEAVRRKGIGRQLIAKAEGLAIQNGCDHIHLDTFGAKTARSDFLQMSKLLGTLCVNQPVPPGQTPLSHIALSRGRRILRRFEFVPAPFSVPFPMLPRPVTQVPENRLFAECSFHWKTCS